MSVEAGENGGGGGGSGGGGGIGDHLIKSAASAKKTKEKDGDAVAYAALKHNVTGTVGTFGYVTNHPGVPPQKRRANQRKTAEDDEARAAKPFLPCARYRGKGEDWTQVPPVTRGLDLAARRHAASADAQRFEHSCSKDPCHPLNNPSHQLLDASSRRSVVGMLLSGQPVAETGSTRSTRIPRSSPASANDMKSVLACSAKPWLADHKPLFTNTLRSRARWNGRSRGLDLAARRHAASADAQRFEHSCSKDPCHPLNNPSHQLLDASSRRSVVGMLLSVAETGSTRSTRIPRPSPASANDMKSVLACSAKPWLADHKPLFTNTLRRARWSGRSQLD
ncbi:hypothetical protein DIPPA_21387 [Diplonema papillatum]|nr:hypothetical protein DIPPA_29811 [Diplonema papillatum]KAJ9463425.1 hypothetical protein DIPPA_21387 [Diplonema papillatum]